MDDKQMLLMAAKAAGIELCWFEVGDGDPDCRPGWYCTNVTSGGMWNPLKDDGDALRLAVKLNLSLKLREFNQDVEAYLGGLAGAWVRYGNDPYAATRLAIVRAAAAIGEQSNG